MPSQAKFARKRFFIRADFQEASRQNKYHGKWYSEGSFRDRIHQNFEIKTALAFTGKDLRTAISKYKLFKHAIQDRSNTNQWEIYSLNYHNERKRLHLFQSAPIGNFPVEIPKNN